MIRILATFAGLLLLGGGGFLAARWSGCDRLCVPAGHAHDRQTGPLVNLPELDWLEGELSLTAPQSEKVRELHVAYLPHCAEMCERILAAERELRERTLSADSVNADVEAALARVAEVRRECLSDLLRHVYRTAACMDGPAARRYLELVMPAVLGHAGPSKS